MRFACMFLLTLLIATLAAQAQVPQAGHQVYLDIKPGRLDLALAELALQTGLTVIIANGAHAERIMTPGLKGSFAPEDALYQLLAPTGLHAEPTYRSGAFEVTVKEKVKPQPPAKPVETTDVSGALEEVEITGSYIRDIPPDISSVSSNNRKDIERSGAVTVEQFLRNIPQNFSLLNSETSIAGINPQAGANVARGTAIDLRGLGPGATLVLLDGQRLAPGGFDGSFVDVSTVPLAALERVDVLSDGASAIYGSDAVAGVVNLVMRRDFVGWETTPYYGYTTGGGGRERGLSQLAGNCWPTGGFMVVYENYQQQAVDASTRHTLVPQSGPYQAVPSEDRQSAVLRVHGEVAEGTELLADARYGERNFAQDYLSSYPPVSTRSQGRATMKGGSFTVVQLLPREWRSDLIGAYSGEEESVTESVSTIAQSSQTHASVASVDWRANGPVMSAAGGLIKLSLGASWRWEAFNRLLAPPGLTDADLMRQVSGAYGEAFIPIVGEGNLLRWAKRVELSLAVRHDAYLNGEAKSANASADNPKIGVLWSPRAGLLLRGSYATSYRIAPLAQMNGAADTVLLLPVSNPSIPGSEINTLYITGGNPSLRPEVAKSFTASVDFKPSVLPGTTFSATYFRTNYSNRIAAPPVNGPVASIYTQLDTLHPYIDSAPSAASIQSVYGQYAVLDPLHIGQAGVQAIFDGRLKNIAKTEESGVDVRAESNVQTDFGDLNFLLQGQYLAQLNNKAAPTTPYVPVVGTPFNPPRVRMQADLGWSAKGWTASTTLDYTGSYKDTLVADNPTVGSWLIVNARLAYETGERFASTPLENATVAVSVGNLMNRAVPHVEGLAKETLGYDPSNASPLGRSILFEVKKRW